MFYSIHTPQFHQQVIGSHEHQQLALEAARQSIVLLKNSNNILPLNLKKIRSIAVLGINAATCEFGDYSGNPINEPVSPLQGIINKAGGKVKVLTLPWVGKSPQPMNIPSGSDKTDSPLIIKSHDQKSEKQFLAEIKLAKKCDVAIVVLGVNKSIEMEGRDRTTLDCQPISKNLYKDIYKANPRTIVVLIAGSSLAINWIQDNIPAVVNAWYPGNREAMQSLMYYSEIIILPEDFHLPIINPQAIYLHLMIMKYLMAALICISIISHYILLGMD